MDKSGEDKRVTIIVNISLQNHPVVLKLAQIFKVKIANRTPTNTIQFASYRKTCLFLNPRLFSLQDINQVVEVLEKSSHPFILLSCNDEIQHLQGKETSGMVLGIQKELESKGYKGLLVATALNHDMAVQAIRTILNTNKEDFIPLVRQETKRMILEALDPEKQKRTLVLSGVCEDRADSVMLMLESGSIRGVGQRALEETDSKVVAIRNLQVDADLCEI